MIKKFLKIAISSTILYTVSFANLSSDTYISVYEAAGGFKKAQRYSLVNDTYRISIPDDHLSKSKNHKFFIPNLTKRIDVSYLRYGSLGWMDAFIAIGHKPYLKAPNGDDFTQGSYTISLNKYGESYEDSINGVKFQYLSSYKNTWKEYLFGRDPGWTLRYWNVRGIYLRGTFDNQEMQNLNKWVYFAIDDRPSKNSDNDKYYERNGENLIRGLTSKFAYYLDKESVDEVVATNGFAEKFANECNYLNNTDNKNAINACYYVKAFGNDNNIVEGYESNVCPHPLVDGEIELIKGWNFITPKEKAILSSEIGSNLALTFKNGYWRGENTSATSQKFTAVEVGDALWIKSSSNTILNYKYCEKKELGPITIGKGWSMINATNLSSNGCVKAAYYYNNNDYYWEDLDLTTAVTLRADSAVWVYTDQNSCTISQ